MSSLSRFGKFLGRLAKKAVGKAELIVELNNEVSATIIDGREIPEPYRSTMAAHLQRISDLVRQLK